MTRMGPRIGNGGAAMARALNKERAAKAKPKEKWIDATSYGRDERGKAEPRCFALADAGIDVTVHRWMNMPGLWFVSCVDLRIERAELVAKDKDAALAEAIEYIHDDLMKKLSDFRRAAELPCGGRDG